MCFNKIIIIIVIIIIPDGTFLHPVDSSLQLLRQRFTKVIPGSNRQLYNCMIVETSSCK